MDWPGVRQMRLTEMELSISENNNKEEGYGKKIIGGRKLAAALAKMGKEIILIVNIMSKGKT